MSEECKKIKPEIHKSIYEIIKQNFKFKRRIGIKKILKRKLIYIATPFSFKAAKWLGKIMLIFFK